MSWLFSQALVAEYSAECCTDEQPSAQLNVMPTQHKFWRNDKTMEFSDLSRFGLTLQLLTEDLGAELLMSFLQASRARTSALPAKAQEFTASAPDCGEKQRVSFAKWTPTTSSWKTAQHSLFADSGESLETWPRWGSMRNGECFHAQKSAEYICENASGLKLPTTGANEGKGASKDRFVGSPAFRGAKMCEGLRTCETDPIYLNPLFAELTMMWPLGWTDLKPLEMDKFLAWQQQHGHC